MDQTFSLGRHEALIEALVDTQRQLVADVGEIKQTLAEERGARRFKAGAWGLVGGILSALVSALFHWHTGVHS